MGLDMYAYKVKKGVITESVDFDLPESSDDHEEFFYWRKHPNLHGWMEDLYRDKGGKDESFNCSNVQLTEEDVNNLESDIKDGLLPETAGFFFGTDESSEEEKNTDLEFVERAREAISEGYDVYYTSWW